MPRLSGGGVVIRYPGLTARENEVMQLVCEGLSNDEIGVRLGTSAGTVSTQIKHIYRKCGWSNQRQATAAYTSWRTRLETAAELSRPPRRVRRREAASEPLELIP